MKRTLAVVAAVLLLAGCATDFNDPQGRTEQVTDPEPAPEVPDPDPISFDVGDCLRVDASGVSPRFEAVVDCNELHEAQVYMARTVAPEYGIGAIALECTDSLRSAWEDPADGRALAVTSPLNYVHNVPPIAHGDEVLCVYIHTMPRNESAKLTNEPARVEPSEAPDDDEGDSDN